MDTNRLRYFLVAAEAGNFRMAAEILHISHSGLSKAIAALEDEIGSELFKREGRGVVLTDRGRDVAQRGKLLLQQVDAFLSHKPPSDEAMPLRIATFEVFSTYFIGALCDELWGDEPFTLRELIPGPMEAAVASGQADVGITYEPIATVGVEFLRVTHCQMGVYGRRSVFGGKPFEEIPFAAPAVPLQGTPTGVKGLDGWPDDRVPRQIRYAVDMMESALELGRRGRAVIFLPQFIARLHNAQYPARHHLEEIALTRRVDVRRAIYLVRRVGAAEDRAIKMLARGLRQIVNAPIPP